MNIDSVPQGKMVDEHGQLMPYWRNYLEQLIVQIQTFLSDERYLVPHQPDRRSQSTNISALNKDDGSNLGGIYYNSTDNGLHVNLKTYTSGGPTKYEFKPNFTYHSVETSADRDAIPPQESEGKIVSTEGSNTEAYIYINGAWRTISLT